MNANKKTSDIIDIPGLLQQYRAKWYLFAISIACCLALAMFWSKIKPPVYSVTANVLIDAEGNDPLASLGFASLFSSGSSVDDEIFVISSHSLYVDVARELGLDRERINRPGFMQKITMREDYPLDVIAPAEFADTARMSMTFNVKVNEKGKAQIKVFDGKHNLIEKIKDATLPTVVKTPYGDFSIVKTPAFVNGESYKYRLICRSYDGAAEELGEKISALIANKRTHVIELSYPTPDPEFGMKLLNTLMAKYDQRVIGNKSAQNNQTMQFLDDRLAQVGTELAKVEQNLQNFKESNNLVDLEADAEYSFAMKGEIAKKLFDAESQLEIARMARDFIANPGNNYALIPFAPSDEQGIGVNAMVKAYNELAVQRVQLLTNAKEDNLQVARTERQMDAMKGNIAESINKNYANILAVVKELRSKMNQAEGSLGKVPSQERKFQDLMREQRTSNGLYLLLLEKREETSVMLANAVSKGVVVDPAFVLSEPISISRKKLLAVALFVGLLIPVVFLYTRKLLRGRPETREELESLSEAPILGEISNSRAGKHLVVTPNSVSSTVELFKLVRTNLMFMLRGKENPVVMVTSTNSGEGKSFISINLASTLALQSKKVLLVGLDIRKPMLADYLGLDAHHPGITNYLSRREVSFDQIVQHVGEVKGLDVVAAGVIPPNPAELLLDPRLKDFFETARQRYDYIIVDSAPAGMVSDSLSVAEFADASIYVTRLGVTKFSDIKFLNSLCEEQRLPKMSVIVNGTTATRGYGYGYGSVEDHGKLSVGKKKNFFSRLFSRG